MLRTDKAVLFFCVFLLVAACSDPSGEDNNGASDAADIEADAGDTTDPDADALDAGDAADSADADAGPGLPTWPAGAALRAIPSGPSSVRLEWDAAQDNSQVAVYEVFQDGVRITRKTGLEFSHRVSGLDAATTYEFEVVARDDENQPSADAISTSFKLEVPEPSATVSNTDEVTDSNATMRDRVEHVFTGDDPIQRDVDPEDIEEERVSVLTGRVLDGEGTPLSGVHVSVRGMPQYGYTLSRTDGAFTLVVNGGGEMPVEFQKDDYLTAQRRLEPQWLGSHELDDVRLLQLDPTSTTVDLSSGWQIAEGSVVSGPRGERQAAVYFPTGTQAHIVLPDDSRQATTELTVRITEYTVGDDGPEQMPADLPKSTVYTHAMELSADEAVAVGADEVEFNQPVSYYVDNFLGFDVGFIFPFGSYDRRRSVWVSQRPTVVMSVLSINSEGLAVLDVTGDGQPATDAYYEELKMTEEEREAIASRYAVGDEFWRVQTTHFSPHDPNGRQSCDSGASPDGDDTNCEGAEGKGNGEDPSGCGSEGGSIIECDSQILRESIPVTGTPMSLHYNSGRQFGYASKRIDRLNLHGDQEPTGLTGYASYMRFEGTSARKRIPQPAQQSTRAPQYIEFEWDGTSDITGERVNSSVFGTVGLSFCYPVTCGGGVTFGSSGVALSASASAGGSLFNSDATRLAQQGGCSGSFCSVWQDGVKMLSWTLPKKQLGGWTLSPHHHLDRVGQVLHLGDGTTRRFSEAGPRVELVAGGQSGYPADNIDGLDATSVSLRRPDAVEISADGTVYFAAFHRVIKIDEDGKFQRVAGKRQDTWGGSIGSGYNGDGGLAGRALLNEPSDIELDGQGNLYIADTDNRRIRRVDAQTSKISTVAGNGGRGKSGDRGPATEAKLYEPMGIALGQEQSIYIADRRNHTVRRVGSNGVINTIAGSTADTGADGFSGDGGPAVDAQLNRPRDVEVGPDGAIYIADSGNDRIRIIRNGTIDTLAGGGTTALTRGARLPATDIELDRPMAIEVTADKTVYVAIGHSIVAIKDGHASVVAGGSAFGLHDNGGFNGNDRPPTSTQLDDPSDVAAAPDGTIYFADRDNKVLRRVSADYVPASSAGGVVVPSLDGDRFYEFDAENNHVRTTDTRSGALVWSFSYDTDGLLESATDVDGLTTTLERDADGNVTAIVGPYGHETTLELYDDAGREGLLEAVTNPANESTMLDYEDPTDAANQCADNASTQDCCRPDGTNCEGLLNQMVEPEGGTHSYDYNWRGRLVRDSGPEGFEKTIQRTIQPSGLAYSVDVTSASGAARSYAASYDGEDRRVTREISTADGRTLTSVDTKDHFEATAPDGTTLKVDEGPDPRFGMFSPVPSQLEVKTPGGRTFSAQVSRSVTQSAPEELPTSTTTTSTFNGLSYTRAWSAATQSEPQKLVVTSPQGREVRAEFDPQRRPTRIEIPGLAPTEITYDNDGRMSLVRRTDTGSGQVRETSRTYHDGNQGGPAGALETFTDALGQSYGFGYDDALRTTLQTYPDYTSGNASSASIGLGYNDNGELTSLTPPGRPAHGFARNAANMVTQYDPPALQSVSVGDVGYEYNADYQLDRLLRPDGIDVDFIYEQNSRELAAIAVPGERYEYAHGTASGNLDSIAMLDGAGNPLETLTYTYDGTLQTSVTWSGSVDASVERQWDDFFRQTRRTVNGSSPVDITYTDDGLVDQSGQVDLSYGAQNTLLQSATLAGGAAEWTYNGFGEETLYTVDDPADTTQDIVQVDYDYDKLGRIETLEETIDGQNVAYQYAYDERGRLVEVFERDNSGAFNSAATYGYDANGNRTSVTDIFGTIQSGDIVHDDQDRLLQYGDLNFTYTEAGELESKTDTSTGETTQYTYDVFGNLERVELPGSQGAVAYPTDPDHRRIGRVVEDDQGNVLDERYWVYKDELNPIAELDAQGTVTARFVYASKDHVPDYMVKGGTTYRLITDHLGSVRLVVNTTDGTVAQRMDYDAFGNVLEDTNPGFQPFGYAGGLYDPATELVRFGARDYDPRTGRWTAKDPILFDGGQANIYVYVANNPVNLVDPSGEIVPLVVGVVVTGALVGGGLYALSEGLGPVMEDTMNRRDDAILDLADGNCTEQNMDDLRDANNDLGGQMEAAGGTGSLMGAPTDVQGGLGAGAGVLGEEAGEEYAGDDL